MFVRYYQITLFYGDFWLISVIWKNINDKASMAQVKKGLMLDIDQKGDMIWESNYRLMELEVTVSYKCWTITNKE